MPLRVAVILASLFGSVLVLLLLAWLTGSELYFFLPSRNVQALEPPTHPGFILALLTIVGIVMAITRHYGMMLFAVLPIGLVLGTIVGPLVRDWHPGVCQYLLIIASMGALMYGWSQNEYLNY